MAIYRKQNDDGTYAVYNGSYIATAQAMILNPTAEILAAYGYEEYTPEEPELPTTVRTTPSTAEVLESLKALLAEQVSTLTDEQALSMVAVFPTWESKMGQAVSVGERLWYDGNLYKVTQQHTVQMDWTPTVTPALFTIVSNEISSADGSLEAPYEWSKGMECENGKYYTYDGVTYLCIRDSGIGLQYSPSELLGNYFQTV